MNAAVLNTRTDRPRKPGRTKGKGWAFVLAVAVQIGFLAVLARAKQHVGTGAAVGVEPPVLRGRELQ